VGTDVRHGIEAWLALSDGSPEQEQAISEAVMEMVSLVHMSIDALCRHLPQQEAAIRRVVQHLLAHPECLEGGPCLDGSQPRGAMKTLTS
jgi:hypothetical protein